MKVFWGFLAGLGLGGIAGIVVMALMAVAKQADKEMIRWREGGAAVKKIYIGIINKNGDVTYFAGYGDKLTGKGLGSGALTSTNRVPVFTKGLLTAKKIETYIDAKRIVNEIIDAIKYKDIKPVQLIGIYFE